MAPRRSTPALKCTGLCCGWLAGSCLVRFHLTSTSFPIAAYLLWVFVPDAVWHPLGITYYPSRYWAYAAPIYLFLAWCFSIAVYFAVNLINTEPLDSYYTITGRLSSLDYSLAFDCCTDEKANEEGEVLSLKEPDQIVPIADIPITVVHDLLYTERSYSHALQIPSAMNLSQSHGSRLLHRQRSVRTPPLSSVLGTDLARCKTLVGLVL